MRILCAYCKSGTPENVCIYIQPQRCSGCKADVYVGYLYDIKPQEPYKKNKQGKRRLSNLPIRTALHEKEGGVCHYCRKELTINQVTIDHIIPKSKGGKNSFNNYVCACQKCNSLKSSLDYDFFMALIKNPRP